MSTELPPQIQHQLAQLQQIQQQAQAIFGQRTQVEMMLRETERALEELEKLDKNAVIYKAIGELLIKSEKSATQVELEEKKETLELRLKTLEKQEKRIQKRFQELQEQLRPLLRKEGEKKGS
ncbi:MAG: prefoldin subunit beta [Methanocellales archaeon]|nr:prefoldin subunit beta [Methanocellales archaeon]